MGGSLKPEGAMGSGWDEARWEALAAEAFVGMKEWRLQHPRAAFAEIEQALDARLSALRAMRVAKEVFAGAK